MRMRATETQTRGVDIFFNTLRASDSAADKAETRALEADEMCVFCFSLGSKLEPLFTFCSDYVLFSGSPPARSHAANEIFIIFASVCRLEKVNHPFKWRDKFCGYSKRVHVCLLLCK